MVSAIRVFILKQAKQTTFNTLSFCMKMYRLLRGLLQQQKNCRCSKTGCLLSLSAVQDNNTMSLKSGVFLLKREGVDSSKKDTVFYC